MYLRFNTYRRLWVIFVATVLLVLLTFIPARLAIAHFRHPIPDTILTLGGGLGRETFTAQFAQLHPDIEIWVSAGSSDARAQNVFRAAGIADERVNLDRRAIDTVTNFTSLVHDFKKRRVRHLYLITTDFHMRRSLAIAFFILGSQGIAYTPVEIPSNVPDEPLVDVVRDVGRSLLWIATGHTGASLHPQLRT